MPILSMCRRTSSSERGPLVNRAPLGFARGTPRVSLQTTPNARLANYCWLCHLDGNSYTITPLANGLALEVPDGTFQNGEQIHAGINRNRQVNNYDPDGERVEIKEPLYGGQQNRPFVRHPTAAREINERKLSCSSQVELAGQAVG